MNPQQLGTLNAMVTYMVENVPGGPSEDEQKVARIVGRWALQEKQEGKTHNYATVNASHYADVTEAANAWAERGWRLVAIIPSKGPGYAHQLLLERPVGITHPDD